MGGDSVEAATRRAWKEVMTDGLMSQFTWKGQVKKGSKKEVGLALSGSKMSLTVFGKFALLIYVIFTWMIANNK